MVFIYRQEILKDICLFTSQPKVKFYDELFINLDLSCIPEHNSKTGRSSYSNHAMICAFIVMKCEGFSQIADLHDYLSNNLIVAHYCGFDIFRKLPSYAKFTRFIREFDNDILQTVMQSQFLKASGLSLVDSSFIALDATPVKANVSDSSVTLEILKRANSFLPLTECSFLADKAYDVKAIYNDVLNTYGGDCFIALGKRDPNPYWFNIRDFRRYCVKHLENTASILCGVFLIPTKISYVKLLAPADEMFFARFQCGRMQAGLTPVKSDKLKDCKNIHRQAMRVRVSFA